jgi:molybdopterin molybdotransferase
MNDELLHPDAALRLVLDAARGLRPAGPATESLVLAELLGRHFPGRLPALVDQPPFDKSAMDGFAWAARGSFADPGPLRVVLSIAAGVDTTALPPLGPGTCARIMTGAPLPRGADAVQRVEWTREEAGEDGSSFVSFTAAEAVSNVIARGENQRTGDLLLSPRVLRAQDIGILASSGLGAIEVARRPIVGVISTGDELCSPGLDSGEAGSALPPGAIYDSNGPQLAAQAASAGCELRRYGIVRDDPLLLAAAVDKGLAECDVLLVSGGVSMGDFDYVPKTLLAAGVEKVFHGLAMRPGKPTFFGRRGDRTVFGLPGNPMSTFVNFEVLVLPHLLARMGLVREPRLVSALLATPLRRRETDRVEFLPARLEAAGEGGFVARPLAYHGSSMLAVLATADCLLRMDLGVDALEAGRRIDVRLIGS